MSVSIIIKVAYLIHADYAFILNICIAEKEFHMPKQMNKNFLPLKKWWDHAKHKSGEALRK